LSTWFEVAPGTLREALKGGSGDVSDRSELQPAGFVG
jgi:hypothetical protein